MKVILIFGVLLMTSCANMGDKSADTQECREHAYGKNNETLGGSVDTIFCQCLRKKAAMRAEANKRENAHAWLDFFGEVFFSSKSANH